MKQKLICATLLGVAVSFTAAVAVWAWREIQEADGE